ncbi:glyoxalase [Rhodospirillaceae bacterium KN72]|uniref:Glyoxalase n=1 Tax=Pacificispira spongiicola TaxID=2729598 RepID=A0A7Y0HFF3_9PROT|nr:VOC family protein [Pacificispira spongiicola]NMM45785.1 glyoxalase [Pacificispira spongiicola]
MLGTIDTIRLFVFDLKKSIPFYTDVLGNEPAFQDEDCAIFQSGTVKLMLERVLPDDADEEEMVGRFTGISFAVQDIRKAFAELQARKVQFDGRPEIQPWGGALAHFFDPDGNVLTLVQYPTPD